MTGDRVTESDLRAVEEMGGCVLPTELGMRAAFEWLAEQEGVRRDWYAEETPAILAGIDAARRLRADLAYLLDALASRDAALARVEAVLAEAILSHAPATRDAETGGVICGTCGWSLAGKNLDSGAQSKSHMQSIIRAALSGTNQEGKL